jgi:hypothetical protein
VVSVSPTSRAKNAREMGHPALQDLPSVPRKSKDVHRPEDGMISEIIGDGQILSQQGNCPRIARHSLHYIWY